MREGADASRRADAGERRPHAARRLASARGRSPMCNQGSGAFVRPQRGSAFSRRRRCPLPPLALTPPPMVHCVRPSHLFTAAAVGPSTTSPLGKGGNPPMFILFTVSVARLSKAAIAANAAGEQTPAA